MLKRLLSLFILVMLWGCTHTPIPDDPTKAARERSLTYLSECKDSLLIQERNRLFAEKNLSFEQKRDYNLHHALLAQCFYELGKANCFNLFKSSNDTLANFFTTFAAMPIEVTAVNKLNEQMENVVQQFQGISDTTTPFTIEEIKHFSTSSLKGRARWTKAVSRHHLMNLQEGTLRFVLLLDNKARPQYQNDPLYLFLREQLLNLRTIYPVSAEEILELELTKDTLYVEGEEIGLLTSLQNYSDDRTIKRFEDAIIDYTTRRHGKPHPKQVDTLAAVNPPRSGIPIYYRILRDSMHTHSRVLERDTTNQKKRFKTIQEILDGTSGLKRGGEPFQKNKWGDNDYDSKVRAFADSDPKHFKAPLYDTNMVHLRLDSTATTPKILWLLTALYQTTATREYTITDHKQNVVQFRLINNAHMTETMSLQHFEQNNAYALLQSREYSSPVSLLSFKDTIAPETFLSALENAGRSRIAQVQFDTTFALPRIYETATDYLVRPKLFVEEHDLTPLTATTPCFSHGTGVGFRGVLWDSGKKKRSKEVMQPLRRTSTITGKRSRANIMRTVRRNVASLKYLYNQCLTDRPELKGKIYVKWSIDEKGKVLHARVESTTVKDAYLEKAVVQKVKSWDFGRTATKGDITTLTYPFIFAE